MNPIACIFLSDILIGQEKVLGVAEENNTKGYSAIAVELLFSLRKPHAAQPEDLLT